MLRERERGWLVFEEEKRRGDEGREGGGRGFTPWVDKGSSRGLWGWNSPWSLVIASAFRAAILAMLCRFWDLRKSGCKWVDMVRDCEFCLWLLCGLARRHTSDVIRHYCFHYGTQCYLLGSNNDVRIEVATSRITFLSM